MKLELLTISEDGSYAVPNSSVLGVKEFSTIVRRDRGSEGDSQGRKKLRAGAELAYVFHMADPSSPYAQYSGEDEYTDEAGYVPGTSFRSQRIIEDFLPEGWKPDGDILDAIEKYKELKLTPSARLLESAIIGLHKLREFFKEVDLMDIDDKGRPVYKPSDIMTPLKDMGKVVDSLKELQDKVAAEQQTGNVNKSGVETNKYSE